MVTAARKFQWGVAVECAVSGPVWRRRIELREQDVFAGIEVLYGKSQICHEHRGFLHV
jgi:hypothetical protein